MQSTAWICATCGVQFEAAVQPPRCCPICEDERQYVGWGGQRWTSMEQLAKDRRIRLDQQASVSTLSLEPSFGIGQRAFLLPPRRRQCNVGMPEPRHRRRHRPD
jgi:hypothetical protein